MQKKHVALIGLLFFVKMAWSNSKDISFVWGTPREVVISKLEKSGFKVPYIPLIPPYGMVVFDNPDANEFNGSVWFCNGKLSSYALPRKHQTEFSVFLQILNQNTKQYGQAARYSVRSERISGGLLVYHWKNKDKTISLSLESTPDKFDVGIGYAEPNSCLDQLKDQ